MTYLTRAEFEALTPEQRFEVYEELWYTVQDAKRKEMVAVTSAAILSERLTNV